MAPAHAACPDKPIKIVVAFAPGSSTDNLARLIGEQLSVSLGQAVVIENKLGVGGDIATQPLMNSPTVGYTPLFHSVTYAVNPSLFANAGYNAVTDLQPVAMAAVTPNLSDVHPDVKATNAAVSGQVPIASTSTPPAVPFVNSGKVRPIAVKSLKRSLQLPDVPTVAELGCKDFGGNTRFAALAPAKTPPRRARPTPRRDQQGARRQGGAGTPRRAVARSAAPGPARGRAPHRERSGQVAKWPSEASWSRTSASRSSDRAHDGASMGLISDQSEGGARWGLQVGDGVVDRTRLGTDVPALLPAVIERCTQSPGSAQLIATRVAAVSPSPAGRIQLLPCVPQPGKIVCLGVNGVSTMPRKAATRSPITRRCSCAAARRCSPTERRCACRRSGAS